MGWFSRMFQQNREPASDSNSVGVDIRPALARRTRALGERQLQVLEGLKTEATGSLQFRNNLDQVALLVRKMRRTNEIILLLSDDPQASRPAPKELSQLVGNAVSEIDLPERVELVFPQDPALEGHYVGATTLLVAELLDNAAAFSEQGSRVVATAVVTPSAVELSVIDYGAGMTDDQLVAANSRIAKAPTEDALPDRVGLIAVGRLADRLHSTVALRKGSVNGIVATASLPHALFATLPSLELDRPREQRGAAAAEAVQVDEVQVDEVQVDEVQVDEVQPAAPTAPSAPTAPTAPTVEVPAQQPLPDAPPVLRPPVDEVEVVDALAYAEPTRVEEPAASGSFPTTEASVAVTTSIAPAAPRTPRSHRAPKPPSRRLFQRRKAATAPEEVPGDERRVAKHDRRRQQQPDVSPEAAASEPSPPEPAQPEAEPELSLPEPAQPQAEPEPSPPEPAASEAAPGVGAVESVTVESAPAAEATPYADEATEEDVFRDDGWREPTRDSAAGNNPEENAPEERAREASAAPEESAPEEAERNAAGVATPAVDVLPQSSGFRSILGRGHDDDDFRVAAKEPPPAQN